MGGHGVSVFGGLGLVRKEPHLAHQDFRGAIEHGIGGERDDVGQALLLHVVDDLRGTESRIESNREFRLWEGRSEDWQEARENGDGTPLVRCVTGP